MVSFRYGKFSYCNTHNVKGPKCPYCTLLKADKKYQKSVAAVAEEAGKLIRSGYDGQFIGEPIEGLFSAYIKMNEMKRKLEEANKERIKWEKE